MKKYGLISCLFISILFLSFFYGKVVFNPNAYILTNDGDGLKSYNNYCWHVKNSNSFLQLKNISYPYYETPLMEDCMPLLSTVVKLVSVFFPFVTNYTVGILNFMIFLSFIIGALFVYLILSYYSISSLFAAFAANAVCILSSQILLLNPPGHLGLSFISFFPMGWYFLIRYLESKYKLKWSIIIAGNILFWTYTHVYLGFIILLFTLAVHLINSLVEKKYILTQLVNPINIAIQTLLPVIIIYSLVHFMDSHPDRINLPFMTGHAASFYSVFMPITSPLKPFYSLFFDLTVQKNQMWCNVGNYIGITSNISIILIVVLLIYFFITGKWSKAKTLLPKSIWIFFVSSILLLLYSMAIPLKYLPQNVIDSYSIIKQFSSLGRFAWAFYYVVVILSIVFLYRLLYDKLLGKTAVILLISVYVFEGIYYHIRESNLVAKHPNVFNSNYLPAEEQVLSQIDKNKFQAILPIPTYFIFNLPFGSAVSDSSIYSSTIASYYSGLPVISTYLSRPSVSESMNLFKMVMPYPYQKIAPEILNDKRDILVLFNNVDSLLINENEREIVRKSILMHKTSRFSIYKLSINSLISTNKVERQEDYNSISKQLIFNPHTNISVLDTTKFVFYNSFDSISTSCIYRGKGSFKGVKTEYSTIFKIPTTDMDTLKTYVLSFWYYNKVFDQTFTSCVVNEIDSVGNTIQYLSYSPIKATIIDGWWYFSEYSFKIKSKNNTLSVFFIGENYFENWIAVDELLIRESTLDVYKLSREKDQNLVFKNNKRYL